MIKKSALIALVVAISLVLAVPVFAAGPNFGSAIYADGETFGTKGTADLPAPNENNMQSFDGLFKFTNGVEGQLAVAEAAPGNPAYNGGRWAEYFVTFTGEAVLVTSYAQLHDLKMAGEVSIVASGNYFQCPLLPDKSE
jgi:hypothetical protein